MANDKIEFNANGSLNAAETLSAGTALTDQNSNVILASIRDKQISAVQPLTLVDASDDPATIRARVVDAAAQAIISDGGLLRDGRSGAFVAGAIQHQYNYNGGESAADSVAQDITAKLPKGWKLKITDDPGFRAIVEAESKRTGEPLPAYIRKVELFNGNQPMGAIGVTIKGQGATKIRSSQGTRTIA
jgi:hypothetical protein